MALPLPRVVADVEAGGPLVTSMGGINALNNAMLLRKINEAKSKYAPLTAQAEAASKLAYANLMGPQFLAKLMGNDSAVANLSEDQSRNALAKLYQAGTGQTTGASIFNQTQVPSGVGQPSTNALSGWITNKLKNAFGQGPSQDLGESRNAQSNPGQYNAPAQAASPPQPLQSSGITPTPEDQALMNWKQNRDALEAIRGTPELKAAMPTYAENTARYKGIIEEGKELGKIRGKSIDDLDQQYQQALQSQVPLQHMNEIVNNPEFRNLRQFPWFQKLQLDTKAKIGTPEQQKLIGDFQTTALKAVAETIMGFKGRILDKEVGIANQMKISPEDTINVMLGKLPTIEAFNEMTKERSRIASQLQEAQHLNRGDALEQADKMIDGESIRKSFENKLKPQVTREDIDHMAQKYNISPEEVKKRLKAKGIM